MFHSAAAARMMDEDFLADGPDGIEGDAGPDARPFAITVCAAALAGAWASAALLPIGAIAAWVPLVLAAHWLSARRRRSGGRFAALAGDVEGTALGLLSAALPAYAIFLAGGFSALPPSAALAAMLPAAMLAVAPAIGIAFLAVVTLAFLAASLAGGEVHWPVVAAFLAGSGAATAGLLRGAGSGARQGEAFRKLREQSDGIAQLLREYEHRGVGWLWQVDAGNRVQYMSRRMITEIGRKPGQVTGQSFPGLLGVGAALGEALLARQAFSGLELEVQTGRGPRWYALAGDPVTGANGDFQGFRGVGSDVTDARRTQERLTNLANMDVLTGLPNRGRIRALLGEALGRAQSSSVPCAILFLDLDNFKPVNDTFGHVKGDAVLQSVAQRLLREVGQSGTVGRIGGDEFAVIVRDGQSREMVEKLGRRLIDTVSVPFDIDNSKVRIGLSIGCAFGPIDGHDVDDLIQKADMALYQAKAQGRGILCAFSAEMQNKADGRIRLEQDLRHALPGNEFRLTYQPLVRASDQRLVGFEALIRWHHPVRGIVSPLDFIPLAEETGIITHLGDWVIEEACRAASHWPDHITVAVNLSPRQLILPALPNAVSESLTRHRIKPNRLELEVTESVFLGETAGALEVLKRLRQLGVGIALDDFGTGYSSLGYLNKAVFHKLKIDGSFVREAAHNKETVAIIQSIVTLANSFRMTITAEGVETMADFERMRDMGCHQIQGYLFGRPLDFDKATELARGGSGQVGR
ncbi:putative bifunctional diguanylate cyclase/phosphodiesterase [Allosphingosinicella vermicomposti]|uniref:putative bifunctional diguanylate cyclase/phosphodiesterase n=1 Tax=Allosphingosinicella vermicomposti TaxID=614671 RepID=UPI000D0EE105|nr:GGDEF and EAL domain-containing protein [Allosphingosinicella vermicomposti]